MIRGQDSIDFMSSCFSQKEALKLKKRTVITYNVPGEGGGTCSLLLTTESLNSVKEIPYRR